MFSSVAAVSVPAATILGGPAAMTMTEDEFRVAVVRKMDVLQSEVVWLQRQVPGVRKIAWGVFWGLVIYAVMQFLITVLLCIVLLLAAWWYARSYAAHLAAELERERSRLLMPEKP